MRENMQLSAGVGRLITGSRRGKGRVTMPSRGWSHLIPDSQRLVKSQITRVNQSIITLIIMFECVPHFRHVVDLDDFLAG